MEREIGVTLSTLPPWVAQVFVVDDASTDGTSRATLAHLDAKVVLLRHTQNRGVGRAIVTGYEAALRAGADVLVVMAGDNQMCPKDLDRIVDPIFRGEADYVKGNRLLHPEWRKMPFLRRLGTSFLARWTNWLGGLHIGDSQCGYTALRSSTARAIPLEETWPRYGYPGHLLLTLSAFGARIREVPVRPVYQGEKSGLRPYHVAWIAALVLGRAYTLRRWRRSLNAPERDGTHIMLG